jgi:hypothetical protein
VLTHHWIRQHPTVFSMFFSLPQFSYYFCLLFHLSFSSLAEGTDHLEVYMCTFLHLKTNKNIPLQNFELSV